SNCLATTLDRQRAGPPRTRIPLYRLRSRPVSHLTLHRRHVLQLMAGATVLPAFATGLAYGQSAPAARLIVLSDLHSAYERTAVLLAAIEAEIAGSAAPAAILINGDVFEMGNVVATRSLGEIDWTFLGRLAALAPTV